MIRFYLAGAAIVAFLAVGGMYAHTANRLKETRAEAASLKRDLDAARKTARIEYRTQTVIRKVYVKAAEGVAHVQQVDPHCTNDAALVSVWRSGLDRMRDEAHTPIDPE